jgi:hypothetical protein
MMTPQDALQLQCILSACRKSCKCSAYFRIELKNSSLDLVFFILSSRNSIDAITFKCWQGSQRLG